MSKKFAITGGTGFIGSNLAEELAKDNEVIVIDDLSTGKLENLSGIRAKLIRGSVTDLSLLKSAFKDVNCVFHLANIASIQSGIKNPMRTNEVNIGGTHNALVAAKDAGVSKFIFGSTAAVYGDSLALPIKEDMKLNPKSHYAVSKLNAEYYCSVFGYANGMDIAVLRFFNFFGPKENTSSEYSGVISRFISAVLKGEQPVIYGDGEQTRDFVFVKDVVQACALVAASNATGVFNVARGESTSLNQLVKMLGEITGKEVQARYAMARASDIRHLMADISEIKKIGWRPEHTMEDGLRETIEWFKAISVQ